MISDYSLNLPQSFERLLIKYNNLYHLYQIQTAQIVTLIVIDSSAIIVVHLGNMWNSEDIFAQT